LIQTGGGRIKKECFIFFILTIVTETLLVAFRVSFFSHPLLFEVQRRGTALKEGSRGEGLNVITCTNDNE
jgi:hypothetical protein